MIFNLNRVKLIRSNLETGKNILRNRDLKGEITMKLKKLTVLALAAALSVGGAMTASAAWVEDGSNWRYQNEDSTWQTNKWFKDANNTWYHFDQNGTMNKGWLLDTDGKWYFLSYTGAMQTGLIEVNGNVYFMNPSGDMFIGEKTIGNTTYNFGVNGTTNGKPSVGSTARFGSNGNQSLSGGGGGSVGGGGGGGGTVTPPTPTPSPEEVVENLTKAVKDKIESSVNEDVVEVSMEEPEKDGMTVTTEVAAKLLASGDLNEETLEEVRESVKSVVASVVSEAKADTVIYFTIPGITTEECTKAVFMAKYASAIDRMVNNDSLAGLDEDTATIRYMVGDYEIVYVVTLE